MTPGIAEQGELSKGSLLPPAVLSEHTELESVAAHRGGGRRGDEDGGALEVQALWFHVGFPTGGGDLLGEGDGHNHIQMA